MLTDMTRVAMLCLLAAIAALAAAAAQFLEAPAHFVAYGVAGVALLGAAVRAFTGKSVTEAEADIPDGFTGFDAGDALRHVSTPARRLTAGREIRLGGAAADDAADPRDSFGAIPSRVADHTSDLPSLRVE